MSWNGEARWLDIDSVGVKRHNTSARQVTLQLRELLDFLYNKEWTVPEALRCLQVRVRATGGGWSQLQLKAQARVVR